MTSRIIHCGLLPHLRKASTTFSRLAYFSRFCTEVSLLHLLAQLVGQLVHFHPLQQFLDRLGAHHGLEAGGAELLVELAELGSSLMTSRSLTGASPGSTTT